MADDLPGLFVGVGVSNYAVHTRLPSAATDVQQIAGLLGFPDFPPLIDPDEPTALDYLRSAVG
ncbi:MAG: hypothetical protein V9G15_14315 [Dermatophilaceae bacterium]